MNNKLFLQVNLKPGELAYQVSEHKYMNRKCSLNTGSEIQYYLMLKKLETRSNTTGQYSKKFEHNFDVRT